MLHIASLCLWIWKVRGFTNAKDGPWPCSLRRDLRRDGFESNWMQFCICLPRPSIFGQKFACFFAFPLRSPGKRQFYAPVQFCVCLLEPRHFWSLHDFCFPIALSREETVFWHPHRVTPLHLIEGGSLQKPSFVCAGWAQKLLILLYAPVQFCVCLLEPRHFWSKVCMIFAFPSRSPGKRQFSGTLIGSHPFIL